ARQLFAQRGSSVTLSEIAFEAGIADAASGCGGLVEGVRAQRLRDVIDLLRAVHEPRRRWVDDMPQSSVIWTEALREILFEHLDRPGLSLRDVARILAVSPRTLQRRLAEEGSSWRAELDTARRERATTLLREGATSDAT